MTVEIRQDFWTRIATALLHELKTFAAISLYLFVYFVAVMLYKASILRAEGIAFAPFWLAAVKALVLGKFVLAGKAMHLGRRSQGMAMIWHVVHEVIVFVALLFALSCLEEGILSLIHGHSLNEALSRLFQETWQQVAASCLLGSLALAPLFGIEAIAAAIGGKDFHRLVFDKRS